MLGKSIEVSMTPTTWKGWFASATALGAIVTIQAVVASSPAHAQAYAVWFTWNGLAACSVLFLARRALLIFREQAERVDSTDELLMCGIQVCGLLGTWLLILGGLW